VRLMRLDGDERLVDVERIVDAESDDVVGGAESPAEAPEGSPAEAPGEAGEST